MLKVCSSEAKSKMKNKGVKLLAAAMVLAVALAGFVLIIDDSSASETIAVTVYVGGSDSKDDSTDGRGLSADKPFATIAYALNETYKKTNSVILEIKGDVEGDGWSNPSGKNLTINFNGFTFNMTGKLVGSSGYESQVFQLLKDSNVTFNGGTITTEVKGAAMIIQNYSNLTLNDMVIDGTKMTRPGTYAVSLNNGSISVVGKTTIKAADTTNSVAFDAFWSGGNYDDGANVVVNSTGDIIGDIEVADNGVGDSKTRLEIQNANIDGDIVYTATKGTGVIIGNGVDVDVIIPAGTTASGFVEFEGAEGTSDKVIFTNLGASSDVTFSKGSVRISGTINATQDVTLSADGTVKLNGLSVTGDNHDFRTLL